MLCGLEYTYKLLEFIKDEIRLIKLLPGSWDDDISFTMFHCRLKPPAPGPPTKRLPIKGLQNTLPPGWTVGEAMSGRYIFINQQNNPDVPTNSWHHPDASFDRSLYELPDQQLPQTTYEPSYEALSYVWGSPSNGVLTGHVVVDGTTPTTQVHLGANLAMALKNLRLPDRARTIWVDAICINQRDREEANREIRRMKRIFSLARRTIIWLGEEAHDSGHALSALASLGGQVEIYGNGFITTAPPGAHRTGYLPAYGERTRESLRGLLRRSWFSRVWVLQEALLANRWAVVQCGGHNDTAEWAVVRKALFVLTRREEVPLDVRKLVSPYRNALITTSHRSLPVLLNWAKYRRCTDPRDKIYGVLGLVSDAIADSVNVDYGLSVADVYKSAFLAYLKVTKSLYLLRYCHIGEKRTDGPSWVPNWENGDEKGSNTASLELLSMDLAAGYSSAVQTECLESDSVLQVMGRQCATISFVGAMASGSPDDVLQTMRQWEPQDLETMTNTEYLTGGTLLDAFLLTIFRGGTRERLPEYDGFLSMKDLRRAYLDARATPSSKEALLGYIARHSTADNLASMTTQEGYFCIAPPGAEAGDRVCVLLGCSLPLLLRPVRGTNCDFQVVGPCYIHGFMDGEALLGAFPSPSWRMEIWRGSAATYTSCFFDSSTGDRTPEDPRLPPLPEEWDEVTRARIQDDLPMFRTFRNNVSGERMDSDPRMLPESLAERGVQLDRFRLV
ncbi:heterokaryon incompatibility protein-domain-containing protein [Podospora didyma]|uniref:Heterokaryon incompatibility protein-domain-containing protein n=1 Tax=Podospora didyma TaxID=330526 RepID=A0AAE0KLD5_9PEZI|nr:heterokaryon incompatibility protein-domain-containing protein [Podospora didyma]